MLQMTGVTDEYFKLVTHLMINRFYKLFFFFVFSMRITLHKSKKLQTHCFNLKTGTSRFSIK